MNFKLTYQVKNLENPIKINQRLLLLGSCFAENIAEKLNQFKFDVLLNPNGIVFNPSSIFKQLNGYLLNNKITKESLIKHDGLWHHLNYHGSFSGGNENDVLKQMNEAQQAANSHLKNTEYLIITLGSAWAYCFKETNEIVSNNHKLDIKLFNKVLLNLNDLKKEFEQLYQHLKQFNPKLKILFTISPVRYLRDGLHENNISKGILHQLVYEIVNQHETDCFYFPAYEIVIDELRDYRFFNQDLTHPNQLAIDYVWEKFVTHCLHPNSQHFVEEYQKYLQLANHKPLHVDSHSYQQYKNQLIEFEKNLTQKYPFINTKKQHA